uniref:Uncharacterized protein n=1 Tax=Meloidogyne hapla TaxID=6305 RepID=A0A1I8BN10_MELHA
MAAATPLASSSSLGNLIQNNNEEEILINDFNYIKNNILTNSSSNIPSLRRSSISAFTSPKNEIGNNNNFQHLLSPLSINFQQTNEVPPTNSNIFKNKKDKIGIKRPLSSLSSLPPNSITAKNNTNTLIPKITNLQQQQFISSINQQISFSSSAAMNNNSELSNSNQMIAMMQALNNFRSRQQQNLQLLKPLNNTNSIAMSSPNNNNDNNPLLLMAFKQLGRTAVNNDCRVS